MLRVTRATFPSPVQLVTTFKDNKPITGLLDFTVDQDRQANEAGEVLAVPFLEHADVFGNCYGTARRFLDEAQRKGRDLLLDIDVQGAEQIKRKIPNAVSIFILPPNRQELEARLRHRSLDAENVIQTRLVTATREIENYAKYDYILVNDRLEDSIEALKSILLAERLNRSGDRNSAAAADTLARAECWRLSNVRERLQPILASFVPEGAMDTKRK